MKILLVIILVCLAFPILAAERAIKRQTLSSPSPVETPYLSGKYRALVIGNNDYDDPEKLWPSLKTAVADAEAVADILKTDYGFAEITLLKNAKQREIVRAFNKLAKSAQENDSVLIYYAGHGYLNEETKEGFWIPVDAEGRDDSTFVSNAIIKTKLGVIADKAKEHHIIALISFLGSAAIFALFALFKLPEIMVIGLFAAVGLLQGILRPTRDMMVRAAVPKGATGRIFGYVSTGIALGSGLAPVAFGWIVDQDATILIFWLLSAFTICGAAIVLAQHQLGER